MLGSALCVAESAKYKGRAWWVAPTYKVAQVGWRMIRKLSSQIPGADIRRADMMVVYPSGGEVAIRSADNPDSLRGEGLDLLVMDECAFIQEAAWTEGLRPALSDRGGRAVFISTPKGRNWFWRAWQRGLSGGEWQSWKLPTSDNPYISPTEIEAARQELPELVFEQEYLAEFLESQGAVFRNILACLGATAAEPEAHVGHRIVAGVDWGKHNDFTAISVLCADCMTEVAHDRFNQIDYHFQRERLATIAERWHIDQIVAESNAMGEPVIEELHRQGLPVTAFMTTPTSKPPLIESLALTFERAEVQWLRDPIWTAELEAYERTVSPQTGRSSYSAPEGMHDDTVMARALARQAIGMGSGIYL